jgi:hypothetical protein
MRKGIITLAALLLLAGCSKDEATTTSNDTSTAVVTEAVQEQADNNTTSEGFEFAANGVSIPMNVDAAPIIEALGEPVEYFEAASCAFQGLDKIYTYNGFEINTYPLEEKDYIASVYFLDDSVTTDKGIYLGASFDEVVEAYGEDYVEESGQYTYTLGDTTLAFLIEEDSVTSITYTAIVEGLNH